MGNVAQVFAAGKIVEELGFTRWYAAEMPSKSARLHFLKAISGIELQFVTDKLVIFNRHFDGLTSAASTAVALDLLTAEDGQRVLSGGPHLFCWSKPVEIRDAAWLIDRDFKLVGQMRND